MLTREHILYIAPAMCDAQDEDIFARNLVDNHVLSYGEGAAAWAKILIAGTPHIGKAGTQKRSVLESTRRLAISMLPLSLAT